MLLRRTERMDGLDGQRALDRRQRAQTRVGALQFLHDKAVRCVAKPGAAVLFQIRSIESQLTHTRREMFRELARAMTWNDLGQHFLLHKAPCPIARSALLIRQKFFDFVVVERGWGHPMRLW